MNTKTTRKNIISPVAGIRALETQKFCSAVFSGKDMKSISFHRHKESPPPPKKPFLWKKKKKSKIWKEKKKKNRGINRDLKKRLAMLNFCLPFPWSSDITSQDITLYNFLVVFSSHSFLFRRIRIVQIQSHSVVEWLVASQCRALLCS